MPQAVVKLTKDVSTGEDNVLRSLATQEPIKTATRTNVEAVALFTIPEEQASVRDEILSSMDTFLVRTGDDSNSTITTMYRVAKAILSEGAGMQLHEFMSVKCTRAMSLICTLRFI
jgi:hypothetical protein